jgi:hypothetical protein
LGGGLPRHLPEEGARASFGYDGRKQSLLRPEEYAFYQALPRIVWPGNSRVSGTLKSQKISEEKELSDLQDNIADLGGGLVGKGGIGEGVGAAVSEGL